VAEAKALFAKCDGADFGPLFLTRAMLYRASDPARAAADYEKAVQVDGKTWRNWNALIEFRMSSKQFDKALAAAGQAAGLFPAEVPIKVDLVKAQMAVRYFADAAAELDTIEALPFEGASEIQGLFAQTHVQLGLAAVEKGDWAGAAKSLEHSKEYPEKLGTGKPFDPDERATDYLLGLVCAKLGQKDKSAAAFKSVVDYTLKFPADKGPGAWFGAQALKRAGQAAKAAETLQEAVVPAPEFLEALRKL
jgi:tetratricopeptide (TPR) repeat protein